MQCKYNIDVRGYRLFDIFGDHMDGQINVFYTNDTQCITAWHMHKEHREIFMCLKGSFLIGLIDCRDKVFFETLSDKDLPSKIYVPKETWHGFRCLEPQSILIYYMHPKYDNNDVNKLPANHFCSFQEWYSKNG